MSGKCLTDEERIHPGMQSMVMVPSGDVRGLVSRRARLVSEPHLYLLMIHLQLQDQLATVIHERQGADAMLSFQSASRSQCLRGWVGAEAT